MLLFLEAALLVILLAVAGGIVRVLAGPDPADRMMGVQLAGTGGIAAMVLLATVSANAAVLDVALVLALLAAFASVAFAKQRAGNADGAGDPEGEP